MRTLFIISFLLCASILPTHAMNRWKPSENLDYPKTIRAPHVVGTAENFPGYQGTDFALSTENVHYLKTKPLHFMDPQEIRINSGDENFLALKDDIETVEMSQMKILYPGKRKTSLLTLHVFPCVAVTAYNKTFKIIGMAHIPGATRDNLLNFGKNPLIISSEPGHEKMKKHTLRTGLDKFLAQVTDPAYKSNMDIKVFGGYKNRELLLKTAQYITDLGYSIDIQDIHWGHSGLRGTHFQMDTLTSFDILMKNDGLMYPIFYCYNRSRRAIP